MESDSAVGEHGEPPGSKSSASKSSPRDTEGDSSSDFMRQKRLEYFEQLEKEKATRDGPDCLPRLGSSKFSSDGETDEEKDRSALLLGPSVTEHSSTHQHDLSGNHESARRDSTREAGQMFGLPPELFLRILTYLTPQEICRHVAPVCKSWFDFAKDPALWRHLDLSGGNLQLALESLTQSDNARDVHSITLDSARAISVLIDGFPELRSIGFTLSGGVNDTVLKELGRHKNLREIDLNACDDVTNEGLKALFQEVKYGIRGINLDNILHVDDNCVQKLVDLHRDSLTSLELVGSSLRDKNFSTTGISSCRKLTKLAVSFCEHLSDNVLYLIKDLKLQHLLLNMGSHFTTRGLITAFSEGRWQQLRSVDLAVCDTVNDDVVEALVQCCGTTLEELVLALCCEITDVGVSTIFNSCRSLRTLDLSGLDNITGEPYFQHVTMPYLTSLNLEGCEKVRDDVISQLKARVKNVRIDIPS